MPQMFPLMWFMLFVSIFFTLMIMMTLTHFSNNNPSMKITEMPELKSSLSWKW